MFFCMYSKEVMMTVVNAGKIYSDLGGVVCRRCINKYYRVNLEPRDCRYEMYPHTCTSCGSVRNIVDGFNMSGKVKLAFR